MGGGVHSAGANNQALSGHTIDAERWRTLAERCRSGDVTSSVYETADALLGIRAAAMAASPGTSAAGNTVWRAAIESDGFAELRALLRTDPFSRRCVEKPRGYPGDAELLDMAYRLTGPPAGTSAVGAAVFDATTNSPGSRSVRLRRHRLAQFVDEVAGEFPNTTIASVACGHLRELASSKAFTSRRLKRFLGVDQDPASLAEVTRSYSGLPIEARQATLRDFLVPQGTPEAFSGIYAAGLFDYLEDAIAVKAIAAMTRLLAPQGRLLIANLTPSLIDIAYMEAIMDWWLLYRSEDYMAKLAAQAVQRADATVRSYTDVLGNVAFIEIRRGG